jgi:hypothetical protein
MDDDTRRRCLEPLLSKAPRLRNLRAAFLEFGAWRWRMLTVRLCSTISGLRALLLYGIAKLMVIRTLTLSLHSLDKRRAARSAAR